MTSDTAREGPPPHRYTAALAAQIESRWQERWEREGTFRAANPTGALGEGFADVAGRAKFYLNDMLIPVAPGCTSATPWVTSAPTCWGATCA